MIEIVAAAGDEEQEALGLLFDRLPADQKPASILDILTALRRGRIHAHELLTARQGGVLAGAILYVLQEDRTAFVWPPAIVAASGAPAAAASGAVADPAAIADALMAEVIGRIEKADAWIGQCLIDATWSPERETLVRNGFSHLTDLRFLGRR